MYFVCSCTMAFFSHLFQVQLGGNKCRYDNRKRSRGAMCQIRMSWIPTWMQSGLRRKKALAALSFCKLLFISFKCPGGLLQPCSCIVKSRISELENLLSCDFYVPLYLAIPYCVHGINVLDLMVTFYWSCRNYYCDIMLIAPIVVEVLAPWPNGKAVSFPKPPGLRLVSMPNEYTNSYPSRFPVMDLAKIVGSSPIGVVFFLPSSRSVSLED